MSKRKEEDIPLFTRLDEFIARINDFDLVPSTKDDIILGDSKNPISLRGKLSTTMAKYEASSASLAIEKKRVASKIEEATKDVQVGKLPSMILDDLKDAGSQLLDTVLENKRLCALEFSMVMDRAMLEGLFVEGEGLNGKLRKCYDENTVLQQKLREALGELENLRQEKARRDRLFPQSGGTFVSDVQPPPD